MEQALVQCLMVHAVKNWGDEKWKSKMKNEKWETERNAGGRFSPSASQISQGDEQWESNGKAREDQVGSSVILTVKNRGAMKARTNEMCYKNDSSRGEKKKGSKERNYQHNVKPEVYFMRWWKLRGHEEMKKKARSEGTKQKPRKRERKIKKTPNNTQNTLRGGE